MQVLYLVCTPLCVVVVFVCGGLCVVVFVCGGLCVVVFVCGGVFHMSRCR